MRIHSLIILLKVDLLSAATGDIMDCQMNEENLPMEHFIESPNDWKCLPNLLGNNDASDNEIDLEEEEKYIFPNF